ncbi:serine/threonine-protein kinase haspin homolog [Chenopodium quinoa]|uniref:non-specific serine/threonine protein kinase n=1 Tax=Chenopodium quinoa TaxID=63459 RepID=A0A803L4L8_CHEQI|nr:serine/threonine-protein kinase haspin homolog [Chenopodium quinoa]
MGSNPRRERKSPIQNDLWNEIIAEDHHNLNRQKQPQIVVTYQRHKSDDAAAVKPSRKSGSSSSREGSLASRVSFVAINNNSQRVSWNRSLSTRGRASIAILAVGDYKEQQQRAPKRKPRPPLPKGKVTQASNFEKERAYFQEVDADELLEESPSPKKVAWVMGIQPDNIRVPPLCSRLEKWLHAKKQHVIPSSTLSTILRTPDGGALEPIPYNNDGFDSSFPRKSKEFRLRSISGSLSVQDMLTHLGKGHIDLEHLEDKDFDDIESEIKKLSLASRLSSLANEAFFALLKECEQSAPSTLFEVFSNLCDTGSIIKIGEGTFGEAFIAGSSVCKIVPIDGELRVNGEIQKRSMELLEEVILSRTLNRLRGSEVLFDNATTTFIQTKDIKVCQGPYDPVLLKAWENWDTENGSENDHPKQFPENQCYLVSILEHGGTDLESFVLLDFNEAQSLLVQVTAALAVAEAAFEFEHRDLHWGNILLSRRETAVLQFTLEGRTTSIRTHGLLVSIIDFTLSRINTGNTILYLNLSSDPELFEGPKGDKQAETYRKMREVTDDCWDGSFPKTNVLWLQYLVDILLLKKSFKRCGKDERELRSLKKRWNSCNSAKEALSDPFFSDMFVDRAA